MFSLHEKESSESKKSIFERGRWRVRTAERLSAKIGLKKREKSEREREEG